MKKILILWIILVSSLCFASNTIVTATITGTDGQVWANGSYNIVFQPNPSVPGPYNVGGVAVSTGPFTGSLDSTGTFSVTLTDNNTIAPGGSHWLFNVCPNATAQCIQASVTVTGATQNLSTTLSNTAPVTAVNAMPLPRAYSDAEVNTPQGIGSSYFNTLANAVKYWTGTLWNSIVSNTKTVVVDGSTYPYNRAGIQAAINAAGANSVVVLPANTTITLDGTPITVSNSNVAIVGGGTGNSGIASTIISIPALNGDIFTLSNALFSIRNVQFQVAALSGNRTGAIFNLTNSTGQSYFENLRFVGDATFSAGDIFYANRSSSGSGGATYNNIWILNYWNSGWKFVCSSGTIASQAANNIITSISSNFADAEMVFDGGIDTFVVDNSELFNGRAASGTAPVIWLRNTVASPVSPRWIFLNNVLIENNNGGSGSQTVWGPGIQLDAARSFKYTNGYVSGTSTGVIINGSVTSVTDVNISNNVFVQLQQSAITLSGNTRTIIEGNDFQDIGIATTNTYPAISIATNANYFTISENHFHKFSATNLPSYMIQLASGSSSGFSIANNDFGVAGTDYAQTFAMNLGTNSASDWNVINNSTFNNTGPHNGELSRIIYGGSDTTLRFIADGGLQVGSFDVNGKGLFNQGVNPTTYDHTGAVLASIHIVKDTATLAASTVTVTLSGSAVFTSSTSYTCSVEDATTNQSTDVTYTSGSVFVINSANVNDVVRYICIGN